MLSHFEQKHLPYSREQMFALVAAVDKYHEFAPWCVASRINGDNGSCIIEFSVEFEFKNVALQTLANMFFNEVVKRMIGAFEQRAHEIYGAPVISIPTQTTES